ncbi:translocation and assembly module lipoprotein TamL [Persicitalea jodogahamensis]|uniref:Membrane protein n=1 Tax=Persicitalea jodogahamensis TaxID=402147 RepID=A0A8J3D4Y3_9BACT|nr:BamA/TamA family outer membrane protein [Persicitalea jodogahamensis]GHB54054.1 membrane protein [Persicitalea jodogahamensis]
MRAKLTILILLALAAGGCSVSKYVPAGESLYVGGSVEVIPDSAARKQVSGLESQLEGMLRPAPNATLFGFPYKVWLYYWIGTPRKEKGFRNWFRKKFGEPPVLANQRVVTANAEILAAYMQNQGYFRSTVTGEIVENKKRPTATAEYKAYAKPRYYIDTVVYAVDDTIKQFNKDFLLTKEAGRGSLLREGDPYRLDVIEGERSRVDRLLKEKGYYYFNPDYLIAEVDSTEGTHAVNIFLKVKPTTSQLALKQYYIGDIYVYADYNALSPDTMPAQAKMRRGLNIVDPKDNYRSRIFDDAIGFTKGSRYNSELHDVSLSRLINLNNFKFVKNRFELVPRSDSAILNAYYYLTPAKKKSLRTELSGLTKSNNLAGTQVDVSWSNKNAFRGAELLRLSSNVGVDWQIGGIPEGQTNRDVNNFLRFNVQGELSFPRFIIPFYHVNPATNQALPRTILTAGYETLTQGGLYTQTSLRASGGYSWRKNVEVEHTLTPFGINFIRPRNISEAFVDTIFNPQTSPRDVYRFVTQVLDDKLILENQYTISYKPTPGPFARDQIFLSGGINLAGNFANLLDKTVGGDDGRFFDIVFEQFARFDGEVRYYRDLSPSLRLANRFIGGLGIPYGNSLALPQFKQYFAGGTTGIRAFRSRTLGPGNSIPERSVFGNSQFGDIRLELNTELRIKFSQLINGALFVDAGNVWNYNEIEEYPYGQFTKDFYKQVAIGGGLGLRLDFSFLVFRLDLATPFRKPWYQVLPTPRSPWVFDQINLRDKSWRQENLVLNIAVAYPF